MADWRDVEPLIEMLERMHEDEQRLAIIERRGGLTYTGPHDLVCSFISSILTRTITLKEPPELKQAPLWAATLYGDPRTKKNSMRIAGGKAKCPRCGKPVKQWLVQSAQHDSFTREASRQIIPPERPIDRPVSCRYVFYTQTRRKVDGLNLEATIDDLLVRCHVLADDNSRIVIDHDGSRVRYDPDRPRVEITIYPSDEGDPQLALDLE